MKLKLEFINSYATQNGEYVATQKNVPFYNCVDCDTRWTLDEWKVVEQHDSAECNEYQNADNYSKYYLESLEEVN
jgi:hypothetical protein